MGLLTGTIRRTSYATHVYLAGGGTLVRILAKLACLVPASHLSSSQEGRPFGNKHKLGSNWRNVNRIISGFDPELARRGVYR